LRSLLLHSEYLANHLQPVAGDGNAAVHGRIEPQVVISGVARGKCPGPIQIDNILPMAAHECRCRKFFGKLAQPLDGEVGLFALGSNQRVVPLGFETKIPSVSIRSIILYQDLLVRRSISEDGSFPAMSWQDILSFRSA